MKFSKLSQLFLVSSLGLLVAALFSACSLITIDFVYVASAAGSGTSGDGQIDIFAADGASGALRTAVPAVSSGGVNPVSLAVDPAYSNLYVANAGSSSIVHFAIGLDGGLTQKDSVTLSTTPVAIAENPAGTYLYVVSKVPQTSNCTLAFSSSLTAYPLSSGAIGAPAASITLAVPGFASDVIVPTGLTVLASDAAVYVTAYDQSAYNPGGTACSNAAPNPGWVFGFTVGSGGALAAAANSPYQAGIKPSAIVADPTNRFVYVTDYASSQLIGYSILDGSTLNFLTGGPFAAGKEPDAIVIDPRGRFIYLTNSLDNTVSAYAIDLPTGTPTNVVNVTGSPIDSTDTEPVALAVDPAIGRFVYTANILGNSVSGFVLDPTSGALKATQATPYPTSSKPTAIVVIPHGNHATQVVSQ
jgi:6-phosphogluconolactonase (cycloisomerase 2 family)